MASARTRRQRPRRQRGTVLLIVAILLPFLLSMVAFSVDVGNLYRVRTEGQSATDSAALAGAGALNGTQANIAIAESRAETFGEQHYAYDSNVALDGADIEVGHWDIQSGSFSTPAASAGEANAVRVTYAEPTVATPFAAVQADSSYAVNASAIALGGGPANSDCAFPLVVADCALQEAATRANCDICINLQTAQDDNAAWTSFGANGNGVSQIAAAVEGACFSGGSPAVDETTGECVGDDSGCTASQVTDTVDLNGGSIMNPSPNGFCELIYQILTRIPGQVTPFTVEAPVVDTGLSGADCGTASLNGSSKPVAGFVKMDIFGVRCGNAGNEAYTLQAPNGATLGQCTPPASGQYLLAALHRVNGQCDDTPQDAPAGGEFFGTLGRPRLVQ